MKIPAVLRARDPNTHKGDYGRVLVVAGSVGMTGAAALAAEAALRAGAGLVTLACPAGTWQVLATQLREVMVSPVGPAGGGSWTVEAASGVESLAAGMSPDGLAVAMGPGMGRSDGARACVRRLVRSLAGALVLDADGLVAFEGTAGALARRTCPTVLTPHPGEAARLVGPFDGRDEEARRRAAADLARTCGATVVLKGHRTLVADRERCEVNETGNPGMATGGAGDVLTGVIAGFLAMGIAPFDAARWGAHVHGRAGDLAAREAGQTALVAGDILRHLPAALREIAGRGARGPRARGAH